MAAIDGYISEFGAKTKKFFHRKIYHKHDESFLDKVKKFLEDYNNTDVYQCAYSYENDNIEEAKMIGSPYFDFDGELDKDYSKVVNEVLMVAVFLRNNLHIPIEKMKFYFSGSKGFHLIIPSTVMGIKPHEKLNERFKGLALMATSQLGCRFLDLQIYDRKRLFRIPGSINSKSGLYKTPLTYEQLKSFTYEELKEYASTPHEESWEESTLEPDAAKAYRNFIIQHGKKKKAPVRKKNSLIPTKKMNLLPCVYQMLSTSAQKGTRNISAVALASGLYQSGRTDEEVDEIMTAWNDQNTPPLPTAELTITISSARSFLESGKGYGCNAFREFGFCSGNCRILKEGA